MGSGGGAFWNVDKLHVWRVEQRAGNAFDADGAGLCKWIAGGIYQPQVGPQQPKRI